MSLQRQDVGSVPSPAQGVEGSSVAAAVAQVSAAAQISPLAWELHMLRVGGAKSDLVSIPPPLPCPVSIWGEGVWEEVTP